MSAAGYAQAVTRQRRLAEAVTACQALIDVGAKVAENAFECPLPLGTYILTRLHLGQSAGGYGHITLCTIL
jgi:hypothetical protein